MSAEGVARHEDPRPRIRVGDLPFDVVTEHDVARLVNGGWDQRRGGLIVTPNVDIWRASRNRPDLRALIEAADIVVADGMPLMWASQLAGRPLPERVTGSALVETLARVAGARGASLYVVGGGLDGAAERAASRLAARYMGLRVVGTCAPPFGFDDDPGLVSQLVDHVVSAQPDLVLVGLGFPRQEHLAVRIRAKLPAAWLLGCGAGVQMAAGDTQRPPFWAQQLGAEWIFRLAQEPRRLAHRYLVRDLPAALSLLTGSLRSRRRGDAPGPGA